MSYFQDFFKLSQVAGIFGSDVGNVLQTHPADFRIVKSGLHSDNMARFKNAGGRCADAGRFVDFQTQAMTGAMKEALHSAVHLAGFVTGGGEQFLHGLVNARGLRAGAHEVEGGILSAEDGIVELAHGFARATFDHCPRDVAKITGLLGTRKDVEDDRLVGAQRAIAGLVRVARLFAASDDGVAGQSVRLDDGGINDLRSFSEVRGVWRYWSLRFLPILEI